MNGAKFQDQGLRGPRVLVVDDSEEMLGLMDALLGRLFEAEVCLRSDPVDALRAIADAPSGFDLVVSDLEMPGMDGVELRGHLAEANPELPVVLVTGNSDRERTRGRGFFRILSKPFEVAEFAEAVSAALMNGPRATADPDLVPA